MTKFRSRAIQSDSLSFGYLIDNFLNSFDQKLAVQDKLIEKESYSLNEYGYRCENFIQKHQGVHALFSGCSVTFGSGLEIEETWSWQVYEELSNRGQISGYFNLASPGTSIATNIIKLFKYFREFGNPDVIFLNMPNIERFIAVNKNSGNKNFELSSSVILDPKDVSRESMFFINAMTYELYSMLEDYCRVSDINLVSFSWEKPKSKKLFSNSVIGIFGKFKTFYNLNSIYNYDEYVSKYILDNSCDLKNINDSLLMVARDGVHPGIIEHKYFADTVLEIFNLNLVSVEDQAK